MLTVHRPANTTQPSPPSPLQASLSTLLPAHPHSQERDTNPPSASVGLCLSYPWSDRISGKILLIPDTKKTSIACPAFIATLPTAGKELCIYLLLFFCFFWFFFTKGTLATFGRGARWVVVKPDTPKCWKVTRVLTTAHLAAVALCVQTAGVKAGRQFVITRGADFPSLTFLTRHKPKK